MAGQLTTICIVQPNPWSPSETFIRAHVERLPGRVVVLHGGVVTLGDRPVLSQAFAARAMRKALRVAYGQGWNAEMTAAYLKAFRRLRPDVVLAEYGGMGVAVRSACRRLGIPFVVHFHGYDASIRSVLKEMAGPYREMFQDAAAIVAVSREMRRKLIELGAPESRVIWNPCGVDVTVFGKASPEDAPPVFVAVGRFTAKKGPQLTLQAFARVLDAVPEARLRMVGFGPLLESCKVLSKELGIADAVDILGPQPPEVVQRELRTARAFVQHSLVAPDGDSEGTPVAILEAGASGLPVVATRHAGIPDVVIDGETGFLVAEGDVEEMADRMIKIARDPSLAGRLGRQARRIIEAEFSMDRRIRLLWEILISCIPKAARPDLAESRPAAGGLLR